MTELEELVKEYGLKHNRSALVVRDIEGRIVPDGFSTGFVVWMANELKMTRETVKIQAAVISNYEREVAKFREKVVTYDRVDETV